MSDHIDRAVQVIGGHVSTTQKRDRRALASATCSEARDE